MPDPMIANTSATTKSRVSSGSLSVHEDSSEVPNAARNDSARATYAFVGVCFTPGAGDRLLISFTPSLAPTEQGLQERADRHVLELRLTLRGVVDRLVQQTVRDVLADRLPVRRVPVLRCGHVVFLPVHLRANGCAEL